MSIRILQTNDFHGTLTPSKADQIQPLRDQVDFYFDCGDSIKAGNLAIPLKPDAVWPVLESLRCTASVLGNRETHVIEKAFQMKIKGAAHPILCANLHDKQGVYPLARTLVLDHPDGKVGVVGIMVPMVTEKMATRSASSYLWDPAIPTAVQLGEQLRTEVDFLIALTHIGYVQDKKLAEATPLFDLILGGHSHTVLQEPTIIGKTAICQAGSHGRYGAIIQWSKAKGLEDYRLESLG